MWWLLKEGGDGFHKRETQRRKWRVIVELRVCVHGINFNLKPPKMALPALYVEIIKDHKRKYR